MDTWFKIETAIPSALRGLKVRIISRTRGSRVRVEIMPDQPLAGQTYGCHIDHLTSENPHLNDIIS